MNFIRIGHVMTISQYDPISMLVLDLFKFEKENYLIVLEESRGKSQIRWYIISTHELLISTWTNLKWIVV